MFDKQLNVLEPSRGLRIGGAFLAALGVLGLVAWLGFHADAGMFGLHLLFFGVLAQLASRWGSSRARRRERRITVTPEGLLADGRLIVARSDLRGGYIQPRSGAHRWGMFQQTLFSSVRFVGRLGMILGEIECPPEDGEALMRELGVDATRRRAEFRGSSLVYRTQGGAIAASIAAMVVIGGLAAFLRRILGVDAFGFPFLFVMFAAFMMPSRIAIGIDGVLVRWFLVRRFYPFSKVRGLRRNGDRAITIELEDGEAVQLYTSMARNGQLGASTIAEHREAVLARMESALRAHRSLGDASHVAEALARGERSGGDWLADLVKLRAGGTDYRTAALRDEDLWTLLESPSATEDARAAAALVLRRSLDDEGRARIRVAAEATASPRLRVALDRAADAAEDAAVEQAVAELATPQRVRRR